MNNEAIVNAVVAQILEQLKGQPTAAGEERSVKVGVSARHLHLCREHMDILFGAGSELTPMKELMGGQFAAKETVTIIGLKLRPIENVRVLGP
ncbi:MAG: PduL/EutD family phosphate acyltransferase [Bianqueaceae bacterium]